MKYNRAEINKYLNLRLYLRPDSQGDPVPAIKQSIDAGCTLVYISPGGREQTIEANSDGTYTLQDGISSTRTLDQDGLCEHLSSAVGDYQDSVERAAKDVLAKRIAEVMSVEELAALVAGLGGQEPEVEE